MIKIDLEPGKEVNDTLVEFHSLSKEEKENEMYRVQLEGLVVQNKIRQNLNVIIWVIAIVIILSILVALKTRLF